ncbi:MAG: DUF4442 domain-containing protein [Gammaproteobacteria bacterium]|nr:DUF4442 domain-containing protein [Gammaproteobacteria bacterium]NND59855.1 DUF4442 domain-containing protein [Gammaproteobacteria bacterium]
MAATRSSALDLYRRISQLPLGNWLFSRMVCWRAPYFGSIRPLFEELRPGYAVASMRKRRAVQNHIGTVHAIAMANLCELVAGTMTEVSVPANMRWIPKSMTIEYRGKAETDLRAIASLDPMPSFDTAADLLVPVDVKDENNKVVVHAVITMWVSPRPAR